MSEIYRTRGSEALKKRVEFRLPSEQRRPGALERLPKTKDKIKPKLNYERYIDPSYAPGINFFGFLALAISIVAFLYVCTLYLSVNNKIVGVNQETKLIRMQTEKLKTENDDKENKLYSHIDFEEIREKALRDLGMVYPYKNQVITYQAVAGGYVRQFGELNGGSQKNIFEKILSMLVVR